jgi:hypothetical protein
MGALGNAHNQILLDTDLTGKTELVCQRGIVGDQRGALHLAHGRDIARDDLNAAGRTARIAAATVHHVDAVVFQAKYKLLSCFNLEGRFAFDGDSRHESSPVFGT